MYPDSWARPCSPRTHRAAQAGPRCRAPSALRSTTIYKWWPSSAAIVLEGLLHSVCDPIISPPGSSSKEALEHHLRALNATRTGPLLRDVVAASASDPAMTRAVLHQWLHPGRVAVAAIVRQAVAQGEIRDGTDVDVIVDALISPPTTAC